MDALLDLSQEIKSIPTRILFIYNIIMKFKIWKCKTFIKRRVLDKISYNAFDIIDFVQLLKYSRLVDYLEDDEYLSYSYSTKTGTSINSAILKYSIDYGDSKKLDIHYKATVLNGLDTEGSINMEWVIVDNIMKQVDHKWLQAMKYHILKR